MSHVPTDDQKRKSIPICTGVLDYFPDALLAVAEVSRAGNEQHNPGEPLHWAKEKSTDESNSLLRHMIDRGKRDKDGQRHSAKIAWRALALLQREIDAEKSVSRDRGRTFPCNSDRERIDKNVGNPCFAGPGCACGGKKDGGKTAW